MREMGDKKKKKKRRGGLIGKGCAEKGEGMNEGKTGRNTEHPKRAARVETEKAQM